MSRFTVGQEITVKEGYGTLEYGKFYPISMISDGWNIIVVENDHRVWVSDTCALTREEYEQAEREKDPFAPGKWVVCVKDDYPWSVGEIAQVSSEFHRSADAKGGRFCAVLGESVILVWESHFRPATPEEIYNHLGSELARTPLNKRTVRQCAQLYEARRLAEKTKAQEMKIMDEKKEEESRANRQTFTVGGREFYVGQTVWAGKAVGSFSKNDELEVVGPVNNAPLGLCARKPSSSMTDFIGHASITTTKPKPHEWKFRDWARHPEYGTGFVCEVQKDAGYSYVAFGGDFGIKYVKLNTLTYISTAEIPE